MRDFARRRLGFRPARTVRWGDRGGCRRVPARHVPEPDRDHHVRADAGRVRVERAAGGVSALVVRQGIHPQRAGLPARHAGPRVRNRHQFQSLHRLPDGGEHDGDAGAGHRARLLWPQFLLQGESPVPPMDRGRCDPGLPRLRPRLRDAMRGAARCGGGRGGARRLSRADAARGRPLSPPGGADIEGRGCAAGRARGAPRTPVQRSLAHAAGGSRRRTDGGRRRASRPSRRKTSCISSRSTRRNSSPGSASSCASCASSPSISTRRPRPR